MAVKTHRQMVERHVKDLLGTERGLIDEARRIDHGLVAVREQIAEERRALSTREGTAESLPGLRAA